MSSDTVVSSSRTTARWLPVIMLALGTFCSGTDNYLVAGVLSTMAHDLRISVAGTGLFVTAYSLAYAIGAPTVMTVVRVRSPRRLLVASMALFVVVNLLAAAAWEPWVMVVARIAAGCVAGLYVPLAGAAAAGAVPADKRGRALAIIMGGISIATLAGVPLGVWITSLSSWRMAFVFVAALAVIATVGVALSVPAGGATPTVSLRERVAPLRRPAVLLGLAVTITGMTAGLMLYTYVGPIYAADPAVGAGLVGVLIMAHGFGALIGLWRGSSLVDRFGSRPVLLGCLTLFTANLALQPVAAHTLVSTVVFVIIWGVVGWAFLPAQQHSMIADAPAELSPMLLSLNGSAMYLGAALGSAIGGAVVAGLGAGHIWMFATGFAAVSLLLSLIRYRRPAAPATEYEPSALDTSERRRPAVLGRVRTVDGSALPWGTLTLIDVHGGQIDRGRSGDDGTYRLHAPETGDYLLICTAPANEPAAARIAIGAEPASHDIVMRPSGRSPRTGGSRGVGTAPPVQQV